jgi:hypothetical protein
MSYFQMHCVPLSEAARQSDSVTLDVFTLVLLSIQQPWYGMPRQFADVRAKGDESVYLFGHKRAGYQYVSAHVAELRDAAKRAHDTGDLDSLILRYLDVPSLGLAKASFAAQMTMADGACLDVHNLRRLGLGPSAMRLSKKLKPDSIARKVQEYNEAWRKVGDSAHWWDSWCDALVFNSYNKFENGFEVSAMHTLPLN